MKKALFVTLALMGALSLTLSAADAPAKRTLTPEQKALQKQIVEKYDTNKDGKLSREERAKISEEDQKKMKDAGLTGGQRQRRQQ